MPSTRKQKAKEKRFNRSDVMSDLENKNMGIMLGNYSENEVDCQSGERGNEGDFGSNGLQPSNPIGEDFRSLIKTNSRGNSEITIETARMINKYITTQVTRKLDEIRDDFKNQIVEVINTINTAITEKVLPSIQNVFEVQNLGLNATWANSTVGQTGTPKIILVMRTTSPID